MNRQRERLVRLGVTFWGLAIAIALLPWWSRPAPVGQLPGLMTSLGLDASAAPRFVLGLMLLPVLVAAMMRPVSRRLAAADVRAWSWIAFSSSTVGALWFVMIEPSLAWALAIPVAMLALAMTLRHFDARFDRHDWILLPVTAAVELALLDLTAQPVHHAAVIAAAIVLAVRLAVAALQRTKIPPGLCFSLAPMALLFQTHFSAHQQRHAPWPPLLVAVATPLLIAALRWDAMRMRRALSFLVSWIVYPLAILAYISATSSLAAEGMPRADLFEDAHHLVPASEMLRGETLYRDIIPAHGLIQDGLLDFVSLSTGDPSIGRALKVRALVGSACIVAQYALAAAATGAAEGGLGAAVLVVLLGTTAGTVRAMPALFALALIALAVRQRRPRVLFFAGLLVILSILTSLDFGGYAALSLVLALLRSGVWGGDVGRHVRAQAWRHAAAGVATALGVALLAMAMGGFAGDFLRATLFEIPTLRTVYALPPFDAPAALQAVHNVPEVLAMLFDKTAYLYLAWVGAALFVALMLTSSRRRPDSEVRAPFVEAIPAGSTRQQQGHTGVAQTLLSVLPSNGPGTDRSVRATPVGLTEAALIVAFFTMVSAFSYAERHHTYWQFGIPALLAIALFSLISIRTRLAGAAATLLIVILLVTAQPTTHLAIAASLRRTHGPLDPGWRTLDLPRAHGAFFRDRDAQVVEIVQRYVASHLQRGETFFDFTNRGGLYFLLDRDCPIRQIEVAFYEPVERQHDVINRIQNNPRIRFALVPPANDYTYVDGVPNATRAPLVWEYLQQHFTLDHEEEGVVFWRRNPSQPTALLR